jgi:hypothetical protein
MTPPCYIPPPVQPAGFVAHATRREPTGLKLIPAVIFLSAFLLFQVQPLLSKALLPWFGGTAGVWTVCMLFFQTGLLAGYAYAHLLIRYAPPGMQAVIHLAVLGAAMLTLPIIPSPALKPSGSEDPAWHLLTILAISAGVPYVALAATSPLLQSWISRSESPSSPYPLFCSPFRTSGHLLLCSAIRSSLSRSFRCPRRDGGGRQRSSFRRPDAAW